VYGSLLSGLGNHAVLEGAQRLATGKPIRTAPKYRLYSLGSFPGLVEGGTTAVLGELYVVDAATLARLDRLEGHPHFYERSWVSLNTGLRVQSYLLRAERVWSEVEVVSGDWRAFQSREK
jgi:gamma-glutamylcyclotransferase (GGCT)/AIG2-like uncharacterized protein YtfP